MPAQDLVLLGLLMERPLHGYEIRQIVDERMSHVASIPPGTIYYTLKKLERRGLVQHAPERAGNRPERRVYSITPEGRRVFRELLRESLFVEQRPFYRFDAALYFFEHIEEGELEPAIRQKLEGVERFNRQIEALDSAYPGRWPFHLEALREKARLFSEATERWYRHLERGLKARRRRRDKKAKKRASRASPRAP